VGNFVVPLTNQILTERKSKIATQL